MKFLWIISIIIVAVAIGYSSIAISQVMAEINNCKIWIEMNSRLLPDEEYRNDFVGFSDYPDTTNEEFFKIRFHANFYQCDRWWNYEQVLDDILNERITENYFDDMFWRAEK